MKINELIESHSELTDTSASKSAVVLMTRIRLARNLAAQPFPGWAKDAQKKEIRDQCMQAVAALPQMKRGLAIPVESLDELQKQILVERHLISRELCHAKSGSGIVISKDQSCVVMVNEEDHLRIQVLRSGSSSRRSGRRSTSSIPTSRSTWTTRSRRSSATCPRARPTSAPASAPRP